MDNFNSKLLSQDFKHYSYFYSFFRIAINKLPILPCVVSKYIFIHFLKEFQAMPFWGSISNAVRSMATTFGMNMEEDNSMMISEGPSLKRARIHGRHISKPTVLEMKSPIIFTNHHRAVADVSQGRKRILRDDTSVETLVQSFQTQMFLKNCKNETRTKNDRLRLSIQSRICSTRQTKTSMLLQIESLFKKVQLFDSTDVALEQATNVLTAVHKMGDLGRKSSSLRKSRNRSNNSRDKELFLSEELETTLLMTDMRGNTMTRMLTSIVESLEGAITVHEDRMAEMMSVTNASRRQVLSTSHLLVYIFAYVPLHDLASVSSTVVMWGALVRRRHLMLGALKTPAQRMALWKQNLQMSTKTGNIVQLQYANFVASACDNPSKSMALIERDVKRTTFSNPVDIYATTSTTFTRLGACSGNGVDEDDITIRYQAMLHRILSAYATSNPHVGYGQGMTFIASNLLSCTSFNEMQTFEFFCHVMDTRGMAPVFIQGLTGTLLRLYQLQRCLQKCLPDLALHFERMRVEGIMYGVPWMMTLFCNDMKMHPSIAGRMLDLFIATGWIGLFQFILAVLSMQKSTLLNMKTNELLQTLSKISKTITTENLGELFATSRRMQISEDEMASFALEHAKPRLKKLNI